MRYALAVTCGVLIGAVFPSDSADAVTLTVANEPRPVMHAALQLMARYRYVITYEDARYVYQGDLKDVTQGRRDLSSFPPGKAPKVLRPVGGSIELTLPRGADQQAVGAALQQLVQSWLDSNQGGAHFQIEREDGVFHIVPTEVRDGDGNWQAVQSVLAAPISLPNERRTEAQMFKAIGNAVGANAGVKVIALVNGGFVVGSPDTTRYVMGAVNEPTDSVLMRAFKLIGRQMTWILTYEPTLRVYVLNIDDMRTMPKPMIWP